jgi:hypothetical protein
MNFSQSTKARILYILNSFFFNILYKILMEKKRGWRLMLILDTIDTWVFYLTIFVNVKQRAAAAVVSSTRPKAVCLVTPGSKPSDRGIFVHSARE